MGEALYARLREDRPELAYRTYAPVGSHRDLLAYLVRRLLENGANSSFVRARRRRCRAGGERCCGARPTSSAAARRRGIPNIPLPRDLCSPQRINSRGIEFGERAALNECSRRRGSAASRHRDRRRQRQRPQPIDGALVGSAVDATPASRRRVAAAREGFGGWSARPPGARSCWRRAADLLESRRRDFIALLQREGGKTLDDALSEVREAVDFCRYYAAEGRKLFGDGEPMPGPTGESNVLRLRGRGVFVAISPWNFPLAIFLGPGHGRADGRQRRASPSRPNRRR